MNRGIFAIFSLLSEARAREVTGQLAVAIDNEEGAPFTWAKREDEAGRTAETLSQVLNLLEYFELRGLLISWKVDVGGDAKRRHVVAALLSAATEG